MSRLRGIPCGGRREQGSATVLGLAAVLVLTVVLVALLGIGAAAAASATARTAADLAALAAAGEVAMGSGGTRACAVAAEVGALNGARVDSCQVGSGALGAPEVVVVAKVPVSVLGGAEAGARSRAGVVVEPP